MRVGLLFSMNNFTLEAVLIQGQGTGGGGVGWGGGGLTGSMPASAPKTMDRNKFLISNFLGLGWGVDVKRKLDVERRILKGMGFLLG